MLAALGLYVGSAFLAWLQAYTLAGVVQRTMFRLRAEVEAKLNALPLGYVDGQPRGDLLSRVTNDIDNIAQSLQQTLSQLLTSLLTIVGVVVMMITISPLLAVIAIVTVPLSLFIIKQIAKRSQPRFVAQWRHTGALNAQVEETFTGHALVKAFGRQREVEERFAAKNEELYEASFGAQFISGHHPAGDDVHRQPQLRGHRRRRRPAGVRGRHHHRRHPGLHPVLPAVHPAADPDGVDGQRPPVGHRLGRAGVRAARRAGAGARTPIRRSRSASPAAGSSSSTSAFSYDPDIPLITDLSLVAEPGRTVAIVGPTGAGKTTLVNLIMRFYDLDRGRITLDGVDIAAMTPSRPAVGHRHGPAGHVAVRRDDPRQHRLRRPDASEEQILAAARAAYVDRFVHSLPDGYDTVVDDEGASLSAGEKQLLTIARAFLADPAILILDEATSSVDTRTEVLIQEAMAALRSSRTSFVIAHRLSTIRDADTILVMDAGQIVEQGSHTELLAAGGAYATLYNAQFAGAAVDLV